MFRPIARRVVFVSIASTLTLGPAHAQWATDTKKVEESLVAADAAIVAGPFEAEWESLKAYQVPDWYLDGKLGIFIHWGVYSVPAFGNEWYPRNMYQKGSAAYEHHRETYGPQTEFGYKDFIPMFKAEKFDPVRWARLFKRAGARFVVPVAEHHDGFAMYDSSFTEWCAARMGPERDVIGELAEAVRAEGLVFGLSTHRAENWWYYDGGREFKSDVKGGEFAALYGPAQPKPKDNHDPRSRRHPDQAFLDDWFARTCELVDRYQPQLVWFDWWIQHEVFEPYNRRFAAYYYNRAFDWKKGVAINHKYDAYPPGTAVHDVERGQFRGIRPEFWQTDTSVSKSSWGYVRDHDYKSAGSIIDDLIDIVSKNGALLLNIGPEADGSIPGTEVQMLVEIGKWLRLNGEAIHGTRPWHTFGEGPTQVVGGAFTDTKRADFTGQDLRFTTKGNVLYAICLAWPGETVVIRSLPFKKKLWFGEIERIDLLGKKGKLSWERSAEGLTVQMPMTRPGTHAFVLKITGKGDDGGQ